MANWAELNQDLLILIAKRVGFLEDFSTFGRVCRSWRSVAVKKNFKGSQQVPWLMLTGETNDEKIADYRCFVSAADGNLISRLMLPEAKGMQCFESLGWFVTLSETGDMNLLHPLSRVQIPLPHISALENRDGVNADTLFNNKSNFSRIYKVVLSSRPSPSPEDNYALMVMYSRSIMDSMGGLGLWKPGKKAWTTFTSRGYTVMDITYYKGQLYAITEGGGSILIFDVWGSDHPTLVGKKRIPNLNGLGQSPYIVESEGELFIIVRYDTVIHSDCCTGERVGRSKGNGVNIDDDELRIGGIEKFRVYKVDLSNWALAELKSLGDNTLFVGYNGSISVQASDSWKGIRPNCIYYVDLCWIGGLRFFCRAGRRVIDAGIYNMDDRSVTPWYDPTVAPWYEGGSFSYICPPLWLKL